MAKMVEIKLHTLTCEFAGDDGDDLELTGSLVVQAFDDPADIKQTETIFDFPDGPVRLRKGASATIERDKRIAMATPGFDPPGIGVLFIKFGGTLLERDVSPDTDDNLGTEWQVLESREVTNPEPQMWRLYFGRNEQIVRADFSVKVAHPL